MDKLNRLERAIVSAESSAEDARWAQAEEVVRRLDAGETQRQISTSWLRGADTPYGKAGTPYSQRHVAIVAAIWREYYATQDERPSFSQAYSAVQGNRAEKAQAQAPQTVETASQLVRNLVETAPDEVVDEVYHGIREARAGRYAPPAERKARQAAAGEATEPLRQAVSHFDRALAVGYLEQATEALEDAISGGRLTPEMMEQIHEADARWRRELEVADGMLDVNALTGRE